MQTSDHNERDLTAEELGLKKPAYSINEVISDGPCRRTTTYEHVKRGYLRITKAGKKSIVLAPDYARYLNLLRKGLIPNGVEESSAA